MRILNRSSHPVVYELRGGPLRMTLSTCELAPGEEEMWRARYRGEIVTTTLLIEIGDEVIRGEFGADAVVEVVDDGDRVKVQEVSG